MNRSTKRRLLLVEAQFAAVPIAPQVVRAAFETFRKTGELPEDGRIVRSVLRRAKAGYDCIHDPRDVLARQASIRAAVLTKPRPEDPVMDTLYSEATSENLVVRKAARVALRALASAGLDPCEPLFAGAELDVPDWCSVGLHLIGFPEVLAKAPYEARAEHLFARHDALRARVPPDEPAWSDRLAQAVTAFHEYGELPAEELLRETVLAEAELWALIRHAAGEDVAETLASVDARAK